MIEEALAKYKKRLKTVRAELVLARQQVLPFTELEDPEHQPSERVAIATLSRAVANVTGILVRILDSLPGKWE